MEGGLPALCNVFLESVLLSSAVSVACGSGPEWKLPEGQVWGSVVLSALRPAPPAGCELTASRGWGEKNASPCPQPFELLGRQFLAKFSQRVALPLLFS